VKPGAGQELLLRDSTRALASRSRHRRAVRVKRRVLVFFGGAALAELVHDSGIASVVVSPSGRFSATSRSRRRMIPLRVLGSSGVNTMLGFEQMNASRKARAETLAPALAGA